MNKYVIYTSLVGSYDVINQPIIVDGRFDYILFSDTTTIDKIGVWQIRPIPHLVGDNRLKSRYVKCHPVKVLSDYESSLYIDANIQIATPYVYERFFELLKEEVEWGGIRHPDQRCIYEEICAIVDLKWVHDYDIVDWYGRMKKEGFPENWGLYENNVIFRRHTPKIDAIGDLWWQTLLSGCKRDQFSLMYSLWKYQPPMGLFLPNGECPRLDSQDFIYHEHNPHTRILNLGYHERLRRSILRSSAPDIRSGYHMLFNKLSKYRQPKFMLHIWELYAALKYSPKTMVNAIKSRMS